MNNNIALNSIAVNHLVWFHHRSRNFSVKTFVEKANSLLLGQLESYNYAKLVWHGIAPPKIELLTLFVNIGHLHIYIVELGQVYFLQLLS